MRTALVWSIFSFVVLNLIALVYAVEVHLS